MQQYKIGELYGTVGVTVNSGLWRSLQGDGILVPVQGEGGSLDADTSTLFVTDKIDKLAAGMTLYLRSIINRARVNPRMAEAIDALHNGPVDPDAGKPFKTRSRLMALTGGTLSVMSAAAHKRARSGLISADEMTELCPFVSNAAGTARMLAGKRRFETLTDGTDTLYRLTEKGIDDLAAALADMEEVCELAERSPSVRRLMDSWVESGDLDTYVIANLGPAQLSGDLSVS